MKALIKSLIFCSLFFILVSCDLVEEIKEPMSSSKALILAKNKIKKYENLLKIEADQLPALKVTKEQERYKFEVEDKNQNIWLVVSVSMQGEVNVSSLTLTEKKERDEHARKFLLSEGKK